MLTAEILSLMRLTQEQWEQQSEEFRKLILAEAKAERRYRLSRYGKVERSPTPDDIRSHCRQIQAEWSEAERERRRI